jgi:hypothetical protein
MSDPYAADEVAVFGMVEIEGKRCSSRGCENDPAHAMPWKTPEETAVVWVCDEHAEALAREGVMSFEVSRTCQRGGEAPCGAVAAHLVVVGVRELRGDADPYGHDGLRLVSVCPRHAGGPEEEE